MRGAFVIWLHFCEALQRPALESGGGSDYPHLDV